jgi:DinB family protein
MADLRYPIGNFSFNGSPSFPQIQKLIDNIEQAPAQLRAAVQGLSDSQLDTPYRPDGWTVRQVVHHVPDSHANAYIRFKLAITEEEPTIRPYFEDRWAELPEAKSAPIELSLALLEALHQRWVIVLRNLKADDFKRTFRHPDLGVVSLEKNTALYSWHGQHHVAHIMELRKRMNWPS